MMEMEMNVDLGEDGTESSHESSARSSASSTFCNLETDYAKVIGEMKTNEGLARFQDEYTRMYECLYKTHASEKEISEKCELLKEEVVMSTQKVEHLTKTVEENIQEIEKLKEEVDNALKLADAAHMREQKAQEVIENLRVNMEKLNQEIVYKNKQLAAHEESAVSKQQEGLLREKEKLVAEMDTMRQRLKNTSVYTEELEKKNSTIERQITEMQETLDVQLNEISKEKRARDRAEAEVQQLQEELATKATDLEAANASIKAATSNAVKLQAALKEEKYTTEKMQKEINKLMTKRLNLQTDLDNANVQLDSLDNELTEKDKSLKTAKDDLTRMKDDYGKLKIEKEQVEKKIKKVELERARTEFELRHVMASLKNSESEIQGLRKIQIDDRQRIEAVTREKNLLARSKATLKDHIKRLTHELGVLNQAKKKMEREVDNALQISVDFKKQLESVEKERDKYNTEAQELLLQVENYISDLKLKQAEIIDHKKSVAECENKFRQHQNLFESLRVERNACSKSLAEAQENIQDLKGKLRVMNQQIEQLKEEVATKEANLAKEEFLLGRLEKEKEAVKVELQSSHKVNHSLRREIEGMKESEKQLRQMILEADKAIRRQKKDLDNVMNERDILGTQLVRRNDELTLQYGRINVLNTTLQHGKVQYNQRLEDIRLLKLEIAKIRTENALLQKSISNSCDLRHEILHLDRDLIRERLKVMALEEEVQTPLNIHRWRKLEGTDPSTFELLKKIQILQKRIIKMGTEMLDKEKKVKDVEKLYMNLREILSKHPGPQIAVCLNKTQKVLRERGKKMKCLTSELNMYEVQLNEYKFDMEKMSHEMTILKSSYYVQKRKLQKARESRTKSMSESILPPVLCQRKKFCGGGFNMATSTPTSCCVVEPASR